MIVEKFFSQCHLKIREGDPKHHGVTTPTHRFGHCEATKPDRDDEEEDDDDADAGWGDDLET